MLQEEGRMLSHKPIILISKKAKKKSQELKFGCGFRQKKNPFFVPQ